MEKALFGVPFIYMPYWGKIVIHHTADKYGTIRSYQTIRDFHKSWKDLKTGESLTEREAQSRIDEGRNGISRPWKECGFHWAIHKVDGSFEAIMLRPMTQNGAHSREGNLNKTGIGILLHGNFNLQTPNPEVYDKLLTLVRYLMKTYKIPVEGIVVHRTSDDLDDDSTPCPGRGFDLEGFRQKVVDSIAANSQLS